MSPPFASSTTARGSERGPKPTRHPRPPRIVLVQLDRRKRSREPEILSHNKCLRRIPKSGALVHSGAFRCIPVHFDALRCFAMPCRAVRCIPVRNDARTMQDCALGRPGRPARQPPKKPGLFWRFLAVPGVHWRPMGVPRWRVWRADGVSWRVAGLSLASFGGLPGFRRACPGRPLACPGVFWLLLACRVVRHSVSCGFTPIRHLPFETSHRRPSSYDIILQFPSQARRRTLRPTVP